MKKQKRADGPRILVLDIETAPIIASVWGLWKQNVGLEMINQDWFILSWAAKWLGEEKVYYMDNSRKKDLEDDRNLLAEMIKLLDQADLVIAHNGRKFDLPKINARALLNGMTPPSPYRIIDTLDIVKKNFAFTSNKLAYLSEVLAPEQVKLDHAKFPGFKLWKACIYGKGKERREAWAEMKAYNIQDVHALEAVYLKLRPYHQHHPNVAVFGVSGEHCCTKCNSTNLKRNGYRYTQVSVFQEWKCNDCGGYSRTRKSERKGPALTA